MDVTAFKKYLPRLSRHGFASFVTELFREDTAQKYDGFYPLVDVGEDVFYQPLRDSYGGSIHNVYLLHFPPLELFRPSANLNMQDPVLIERLKRVRALYNGKQGQWGMVSPFLDSADALDAIAFVTNLSGLEKEVYQNMLIPAYQRLKRFCGLKKPNIFVGSCDSFIDLDGDRALSTFERFIRTHTDGLVITLSPNDAKVSNFVCERNLSAGVLSESQLPYEPTYVTAAVKNRAILDEFDNLIRNSAAERMLEEFLVENYKVLFGYAYDRVETQIWLRCPELDFGRKARRLDMFLRNSVTNDWDLVEIKRAVSLTRTSHDVPVISKHVVEAIHQIKNYARLLSQDKIKKHFAKQGMEYFEPCLSVVIGRTPEIPHEQWRWLKTTNEGGVKIVTFDELRRELSARLDDRHAQIDALGREPRWSKLS